MTLRLLRKYYWKAVCNGLFGGGVHHILEHDDILQYQDEYGKWLDVNIVETKIPKSPDQIEEERKAAEIIDIFKNVDFHKAFTEIDLFNQHSKDKKKTGKKKTP